VSALLQQAPDRSCKRRCARLARCFDLRLAATATTWRTSGSVSIIDADVARTRSYIEPETCMAQAPGSSTAWPLAYSTKGRFDLGLV
jgi:hypothetical protein